MAGLGAKPEAERSAIELPLSADTVEKAEFEGVTAAGADGREDIWNGAAPSGY
jgi:hypothetical protein